VSKESKETLGGKITINSNLIKFKGTIIPIRNVSRFRSYEIKRNSKKTMIYFAIALVALAVSIIMLGSREEEVGIVLFVVSIGFSIAAIWMFLFRRYGLEIETNGGTRDFLISNSKKFSEDVLFLVHYALENSDSKVSYVVNMDNRTIKEGDRFENISGKVNIATRGSTIS